MMQNDSTINLISKKKKKKKKKKLVSNDNTDAMVKNEEE